MTTPSEPTPPEAVTPGQAPPAPPTAPAPQPASPGPTPPGNGALPAEGRDHRLHPMSWLFVMLASLREFALPLIVLVFAGSRREASWELFGLVGVVFITLWAVVQYYVYRYRIEADELVIRSGVLNRQLRHVPFRRIHNVTLHQNLLHQLFGVAEVKLESAGGVKPEAQMRVLRLDQARALEALVRRRARADAAADPSEPTTASTRPWNAPLLALSTGEVVRLGLISNRGLVVVAAAFGVMAQTGSSFLDTAINIATAPINAYANDPANAAIPGATVWIVGGTLLFLGFVVALRVLSVGMALMQYHGFRLAEADARLQVETGLFTRMRTNAPTRRIQAWTLKESLLHRWFGRRSLRVDTATITVETGAPRTFRELAPVATPERADELIQHFLPRIGWPDLPWQRLHPRAWRRLFVVPSLITLVVAAQGWWFWGWDRLALLVLLLVPFWAARAVVLARRARFAVTDDVVATRWGWLEVTWRFAEIGKLQAVQLTRSPFDRRHGMATLWLDTAGASQIEGGLRIPYLPEAEARRIKAELEKRLAGSRLRW